MAVDPRIGSEFAGYRILRLIGRGGMSVVYLAEDLALGRKVALKLIAPELAEGERFRERFLRESRLAASLDHPNVIPIYEAGERDGQLFIAMRYVEGADLRTLLDEDERPPPRRVLSVLGQVANALDEAHANGLTHRDVKPENILIGPQDHVYLTDFGLTKSTDEGASLTDTGELLGTLAYIAPEQAEGKPVDGRTDQYSLACVLYESLTGRPPFQADSKVAVLFSHLRDPPPRVTDTLDGLPEDVDPVVVRGMAKSPEERHENCAELIARARSALGPVLDDQQVASGTRSRRRLSLILAALLVAIVAAAVTVPILVADGGTAAPVAPSSHVVRIDPSTNAVTELADLSGDPSAIDVAQGFVWVSDVEEGAVWRIDAVSGAKQRISGFDEPGDLAVDGSVVYVATQGAVARIDVVTAASLDPIPISILGAGCATVAAGELGVWAGIPCATMVARLSTTENTGIAETRRIEPVANEVDQYETFTDMAVGEGAVWITGDVLDPTLWRIDPLSPEPRRIVLPSAPGGAALDEQAIWVSAQLDDVVWRLDASSGAITDTIPVGRGAESVAVANGDIWVASTVDRTITRIDAETREITAVVDIGGKPTNIAADQSGVWVTLGAA